MERIRQVERKSADYEKERDEWRRRTEGLGWHQEARAEHEAIKGFFGY